MEVLMRVRRLAVAVALTIAGPSAAARAEGFGVGSRVRVAGLGAPSGSAETTMPGLVTGRVAAMDGETLQVERADGSRVVFRHDSLRLLQTSSGPRPALAGGLRGALVFGTFGAGVGLFIGPTWNLEYGGRAKVVGHFALRAALVGFAVGAMAPGEHWSRVEVGRARVQVAPTAGPRGRGAGLAVSVGF
jgi:hypothetical protein